MAWPSSAADTVASCPSPPLISLVMVGSEMVAWTTLMAGASPAIVCDRAWLRVCRLSAGPATAANTMPHTSSVSAITPPLPLPGITVTVPPQ